MHDHFATPKPKPNKTTVEEHSEEHAYRREVALFSLKRAALRIHSLKAQKSRLDSIKEEEQIEQEVAKVKNFELVTTEFADTSSVSRGVLSCDDRYFTTVGWGGECKVWKNLGSPEVVTSLVGHKYQVFDVDYHPHVLANDPDIPNIATCGADCTVRLWTFDPQEREQNCLELAGHTDRVNRVKFHPNGLHLVSASYDKTAVVWDIDKEKPIVKLTGHQDSIHTLSLHPDGALIYTGDLAAVGMIWDIRIGAPVLPLNGHFKQVLSSDFHANGHYLATGSQDNTVRVWDLRMRACLATIPAHVKLVSDVHFDKEHSAFLCTASYDGCVKLFSTKDWTERFSLDCLGMRLSSVSLTRDRSKILVTTMERKFFVYEKQQWAAKQGSSAIENELETAI